MSTLSPTYQQSIVTRFHSDKHYSVFWSKKRWQQISTDIDMEQNYVNVTLCIAELILRCILRQS